MAGTSGENSLPQVPLTWSEFSTSLEKLRHKPYNKNATERFVHVKKGFCFYSLPFRDWFRINPLEMVLLGSQSLTMGASAQREVCYKPQTRCHLLLHTCYIIARFSLAAWHHGVSDGMYSCPHASQTTVLEEVACSPCKDLPGRRTNHYFTGVYTMVILWQALFFPFSIEMCI